MPGASAAPALLFQVIDSGPGLGGKSYRGLFDPSSEFGGCPRAKALHRLCPSLHSPTQLHEGCMPPS
jgi:hypothetical protein